MTDLTPIDPAVPAVPIGPGRAFAFGEPEGVLDRRELARFYEIWHNGRWYEPALPTASLAQAFNMSPHHRSAVAFKVNQLVAHQRPSRWLSADDFERFALDFIQMGNAYLEFVPNLGNRLAAAAHAPARYIRRGVEEGEYWYVPLGNLSEAHRFAAGRMFHLQQPDVAQEIYGVPEWLAALQSGLLNENATLFRRRYYLNGAHAGFIFYLSEPLADTETADAIEEQLKGAKGIGNFRNMFIHIPKGKPEGVKLIPIGEVNAKDEFASIKNISRDDLLAAHRMPPQLIGIIPQTNGGFGKVGEAKDAFWEAEIVPLMQRLLRMNEWFGVRLLGFRDYVCSDGSRITEEGDRVPAGTMR